MVVFNQLYQSCVYAKINSYSEIASCFINLNMEILIPFFEIAAFKTSKPSNHQCSASLISFYLSRLCDIPKLCYSISIQEKQSQLFNIHNIRVCIYTLISPHVKVSYIVCTRTIAVPVQCRHKILICK